MQRFFPSLWAGFHLRHPRRSGHHRVPQQVDGRHPPQGDDPPPSDALSCPTSPPARDYTSPDHRHPRRRYEHRAGQQHHQGGAGALHAPEGNFQFYDPVSKILFHRRHGRVPVDHDQASKPVTNFDEHIATMIGFHCRYMISNKICRFWANMVRQMDVEMIVPQHGCRFEGKAMVNRFLSTGSSSCPAVSIC